MYNYFKNNGEFSHLNLIQSFFLFVDFDMQYYIYSILEIKQWQRNETKYNKCNE